MYNTVSNGGCQYMNDKNFDLDSKYIGIVAVINHFLKCLRFKDLLEKYLPPSVKQLRMGPAARLIDVFENL